MVAEKQREKSALRSQYRELLKAIETDNPGSEVKNWSMIETNVLLHEITERRISAIPTWPFDTAILSRFTAILLSVTAILVAAALRHFLPF
jgi:hypothetical protein